MPDTLREIQDPALPHCARRFVFYTMPGEQSARACLRSWGQFMFPLVGIAGLRPGDSRRRLYPTQTVPDSSWSYLNWNQFTLPMLGGPFKTRGGSVATGAAG